MLDDQRPTLTLTSPRAGANPPLDRILIGMHDYGTGLDVASFTVVADFAVDGVARRARTSRRSSSRSAPGVWELPLDAPLADRSAAS